MNRAVAVSDVTAPAVKPVVRFVVIEVPGLVLAMAVCWMPVACAAANA